MTELTGKHCAPCEGGVAPMNKEESQAKLNDLENWALDDDATEITKAYEFKNFYHTMAFVNAVAFVANQENHHPDMKIGYNYCHIRFSTHAIDGLSINDFICAAKIDAFKKF